MEKTAKLIFAFFFFYLLNSYCPAQIWGKVGGGLKADPRALFVHKGKLYVARYYNPPGGNIVNYIGCWDGTHWDSLGTGMDGWSNSLCTYNNEFYAAGDFDVMGGVLNTYRIARWDGNQWLGAGNSSGSNTAEIYTLATYNNELYAGGNVTSMGGKGIHRIARWNGTNWNDVGGGVTGGFEAVYCMAVYKNQLYVGGNFSNAGGNKASYIARWNGVKWDSIGSGLNNYPLCMVVDTISNVLYVGGNFTYAGGIQAIWIAKWDDTTWSPVGNPITSGAIAMEMYHNELFVGCQNDPDSGKISRWNGREWKWVPGPNETITSLKVYNDTLYVGGEFDRVNGTSRKHITKYYAPPDTTIVTLDDTQKKSDHEYFSSCYPNPITSATKIAYSIPQGEKCLLKIYGISGELKASYPLSSGSKVFELPVDEFAPGVYICTITAEGNGTVEYRKMVVVR